MAINIQSLFSDIIETPAQKQRRLLEEGLVQASTIQPSSGLVRTGLARDIMRDMPRQREQFATQARGMLGIEDMSPSAVAQRIIKDTDPSNVESLVRGAKALSDAGLGVQAAQFRGMAADLSRQQQQDLMAQQDFAMRQAQAAESIATSIQNRELALTEEQRRKNREVRDQASALLNQQFTSLGIASRLQDIAERENMLQNRERASEVIASFGDEYASFAELAKTSPDPTRLFTQVYEMELEKQSIVPYEMVGDKEFENALAIAKEHPTLGNEFKDGWMSDPNISEQRFRDYYSRLRNSNLGKSQSELIELFARQNEIGVAEQLSRINVESVANQVAGGEAQGGVDPEAMAGAAAALAESDETVSAELAMPSPEDYFSDQPQRTGLEASQRTARVISDVGQAASEAISNVGQTILQPSPVVVQRQQEMQEFEQARRSAVEAGLKGTDLRRYLDDFRAYQESKRQ